LPTFVQNTALGLSDYPFKIIKNQTSCACSHFCPYNESQREPKRLGYKHDSKNESIQACVTRVSKH